MSIADESSSSGREQGGQEAERFRGPEVEAQRFRGPEQLADEQERYRGTAAHADEEGPEVEAQRFRGPEA